MLSEIKLVIHQDGKVIQTVTRETTKQSFMESLEKFQLAANATLTRIIEDLGDMGDCNVDEDDSSSDQDANDVQVSPKKRKK